MESISSKKAALLQLKQYIDQVLAQQLRGSGLTDQESRNVSSYVSDLESSFSEKLPEALSPITGEEDPTGGFDVNAYTSGAEGAIRDQMPEAISPVTKSDPRSSLAGLDASGAVQGVVKQGALKPGTSKELLDSVENPDEEPKVSYARRKR